MAGCSGESARQVGILEDEGERSVVSTLPDGRYEADRAFLDDPVIAAGRAGEAVTGELSVRIDGNIFRHIDRAVIAIQQNAPGNFWFKAANGGKGVDRGERAIGADDHIGSEAEYVAAVAVTKKTYLRSAGSFSRVRDWH